MYDIEISFYVTFYQNIKLSSVSVYQFQYLESVNSNSLNNPLFLAVH